MSSPIVQELLRLASRLPSPYCEQVKDVAEFARLAQMPNPNNDAQFMMQDLYRDGVPGGDCPVENILQSTADIRGEQWTARNMRDDSYLDFVKPNQDSYHFARTAKANSSVLPKVKKLLRGYVTSRKIDIKESGLKDSNAVIGITFKDADVLNPVYDILESLKLEEIQSVRDYVEFG